MSKAILIVDDEPNVRLNYRATLETEGYIVMEAEGGTQALERLASSRFDLAILDVQMPELDGLELLAEMRQRSFNTPSVIITAHGAIPRAVQAMKLGAIDFLAKPLTPTQLRNVTQEILGRHQETANDDLPAGPQTGLNQDQLHELNLLSAKRLLNLREFERAQFHLNQAMSLAPHSHEAFNLAGVLFEMLEDYDRARKHYGEALRLNHRYEPAQQNMRRLFELFHFGSSKEPFALGGGH